MLESNVHVTNVAPGPVLTNVAKNALKGDGSKYDRTDKIIAEGMPVERYDAVLFVHLNENVSIV